MAIRSTTAWSARDGRNSNPCAARTCGVRRSKNVTTLNREFASCRMVWRMQISDYDLLLLNFLESIEASSEVPDGCEMDALIHAGLATCEGKPNLTNAGRVRLKNLKSLLKGDQRMPW